MTEGHAERRLITVMFIDIVGSTELVTLGPERMKRVLDRCFSEMAAEVTAEGGTVEKYIGDAIFVIFGAPVSHEDDALRALRAAERCLAKAATVTEGRPLIPIRVGVETGDALVDLAAASTDRQRMAVGACVNVATRLQAVAAPGTALVGPGTREAVGDGAALEPVGEVELKGLGRSPAWRLIAASRQRGRRPHMAFVGRDAELEVLELAFKRAAGGRSVLAVVSGPPGQGKTRIVEELLARIGAGATTLFAHCRPTGERSPLDPLRELIGVGAADEVRARVDEVISDTGEAERVADAIAHSAGLRTSDALRSMPVADRQDEITNAWRRYLAAMSRDHPLVVWVDDLHWADPQLVSLIDRLTISGTSPLLFVVTARPEFAQQAGIRPTGQRFFIDLEPLAIEEAQRLAALAGGMDDPITGRAEGNPLFIIELARARSRSDDVLPMTLRGAIGARLDDLAERERQLLQGAAIIGETFTAREVAILLARDERELHASLDRLVDLQYLRATGDGAYRFHHGLVRDVAYGQLPIAERLHLHARYARDAIAADDHQRRAHHLWEAVGGPDATWVWEDSVERAELRRECRDALVASARLSGALFLHQNALTQGERALSLADTALDRAMTHQVIGESLALAAAGDEAWEHLTAALAAYADADAPSPATLHATIADFIWRPGVLSTLPGQAVIDGLLSEGLEVARASGDTLSEARILAAVGLRAGDGDRRRAAFAEIGAIVDRAADQQPFVYLISVQANSEMIDGHALRSKALLAKAAELVARGGSTPPDLFFLQTAHTAFWLGDLAGLDETTTRYETAVASAGPHVRMHPSRGRSYSAVARGDWPAARAAAREVARTMDEHPETVFCVVPGFTLTLGAAAAAMTGDLVEGRELLARAKRISDQPNVTEAFLAIAYAALGRRGDVLRLDDSVPAESWAGWFATALGTLGEWDRVARWLAVLDRHAADGTWLAGALAAALREERAARDGSPLPTHAPLREKGYVGVSELLSFRPKMA